MDVSTSGGVNCFRYFERSLIKWYRFRFGKKSLKIAILFITSGDDRKWRTTPLTPLCTSTKWDLSFLKVLGFYLVSFLRKRVDMKKRKSAVSHDRKWIFKNEKKMYRVCIILYLSCKSQKYLPRHLWEIARTKMGKIIIIIIIRITRNSLRVMRRSSVTLLQLRTSWWYISDIVCRHNHEETNRNTPFIS